MVETLKWDSDFFEMRIGRCFWSEKDNESKLDEISRNYDLIYIFDGSGSKNVPGILYDRKVTYFKVVDSDSQFNDPSIERFDPSRHNYDDLLRLVFLSGHLSRFKKDPLFQKDEYRRLYKRWIDKAIESNLSFVLVFHEREKMCGFVTCDQIQGEYTIGLIAVSEDCAGMGIGSALLKSVESAVGLGSTISVVTQDDNYAAKKLYVKNNYSIKNVVDVYHYRSSLNETDTV